MSADRPRGRRALRALALFCALVGATALAVPIAADASTGRWDRAWGKDAIRAGAPGDRGTGFEICMVAASCQHATFGGLGGELGGPAGVVTDAAGNLYVAEGSGNRIQKFDGAGHFRRAWGKDVIQPGKPGDTGTGFEICTVAADCQVGALGDAGGELNDPAGLTMDAGGFLYVADANNTRIQKFDAAGHFQRAWGKDVVQPGKPGDIGTGFEICTVAADCMAGAPGTLGGEFDSVFGIAADRAGGVYTSENGNQRVQKFDTSGNFQRAWGGDVIQPGKPGDTGTGFEICTVAADCKSGNPGTRLGGELNSPFGIAASRGGAIYVADDDNSRVQKFDGSGNFERTWGKDVIQPGKPGDTGTGFEICTVAADCKVGVAGSGFGGETFDPIGIGTDRSESVYVTDNSHARVQKFDPSGNFRRAWGKNVVRPGQPGDTGTGFEICAAAASCQAGTPGGLGGEFDLPFGATTNAVGDLYVADLTNQRVQRFADLRMLSVRKRGKGAGKITSSPLGITCPSKCSATFRPGAAVTLTATAARGSRFAGWIGACSGKRPCHLTMSANKAVTATFELVPPDTRITKTTIREDLHKASFRFKASGHATGFECALTRARKPPKKTPKPVFTSCRSPVTYKALKPGKYTFRVRARNASARDPSAARKTFTIP